MSAPVDNVHEGIGEPPQSAATPNSTTNVSDIKTIRVGNISQSVSDQDIREFFSFSGEIHYVEMQRETETTQVSFITFKDSQGADTAILLSGATMADLSITIAPAKDYQLPPGVLLPSSPEKRPAVSSSAVAKAEDMVSTMLAKGFILGKDALNKAKAFDEQHNLTAKASATVVSIDQRMGLMEKLSVGKSVVNDKVREMDERFLVSEKTKSAFAVAEKKASTAGNAIMNNPYVLTGASWVSSALGAMAKAAEGVTTMTREKMVRAEEEKNETTQRQRTDIIDDFAHSHLDQPTVQGITKTEPTVQDSPVVQTKFADDTKPGGI